MSNTLPTPTEGLVYTNPTTGKRMKFSDGCWKSIDFLPLDGSDSMQGTLWTPDQLINGNTLTADSVSVENDDGIHWVGYPTPPPSEAGWSSVTYGNGKFVAVASGGTVNRAMYSEDGINWIRVPTSDDTNFWRAVTYGGGKFVAVADRGTKRAMYSEDGINWTGVRSAGEDNYWQAVTYGDDKFVAVSHGGSNKVMYSTDGINWTGVRALDGVDTYWYSVTYGDGKFVALSSGGTNRVAYSTNGINWTKVPSADESVKWYAVTYGGGKFVAVGAKGSNSDYLGAMYSEDGINWSSGAPVPRNSWYGIAYGAGMFVAVTNGGPVTGVPKSMYSEDGINWTSLVASNESGYWYSVAYGDGKFVSVSAYSTNRVMVLEAPEGSAAQDLYFNGDPVVVDTGLQGSLATLLSTQSSKLGRTKYYQDSALPTGDSYDYPDGSLWYQPTSNKLNFYNDSDRNWVQL
jgi:hypothetical protein